MNEKDKKALQIIKMVNEKEEKHKEYYYKTLAKKVLAVIMINNKDKYWRAWINAVEGYNHDEEFMEVARYGVSLREAIAKAIFPNYPKEYQYHY